MDFHRISGALMKMMDLVDLSRENLPSDFFHAKNGIELMMGGREHMLLKRFIWKILKRCGFLVP